MPPGHPKVERRHRVVSPVAKVGGTNAELDCADGPVVASHASSGESNCTGGQLTRYHCRWWHVLPDAQIQSSGLDGDTVLILLSNAKHNCWAWVGVTSAPTSARQPNATKNAELAIGL